MARPRLPLDMDASRKDLIRALQARGHDVTRTPNEELKQDAGDEYQLLWATSHQRILFTFNIKDFVNLAKAHPHHSGIVLANQCSVRVARLIHALDELLSKTTAEQWVGQVRWINDWID